MDRKLQNQLDFNVVFYRQLDRCGEISSEVHGDGNTSAEAHIRNYKQAVDHLASTLYVYWDHDYLKRVPETKYQTPALKLLELVDKKYQQIIALAFRHKVIREEPIEYYGPQNDVQIPTSYRKSSRR